MQPDLTRCGGFTQARRIVWDAEHAGVDVCPHAWLTDLLTAASLHLNAVLPRALFLEYNVCENPMLREVIRNPVRMDGDGFMPVPQGPGLGIEVDEAAGAPLLCERPMKTIRDYPLAPGAAALWWLGQAGYIVRAGDMTVVIDPYLTDSAAATSPEFARLFPPPIEPEDLRADVYIVTHDHLDHLDPETIRRYPAKAETWFVAPQARGAPVARPRCPRAAHRVVEAGESHTLGTVEIRGVFALPTGADVLDTTGYLLRFANGRSVYHTSDTVVHPLVLAAAPREPEVMLVPINGKWGNPGPEQAAEFSAAVRPRVVLPNHYDLMALNAENPETFRWFCAQRGLDACCVIAQRMQPFVWSEA